MAIFSFNRAIVRTPTEMVVNGLRAGEGPDPCFVALERQHHCYISALENAGLEVTELPPLADFPDSVFVEDAALVLSDTAILLRPGAKSRSGEVAAIAPAMSDHFSEVIVIEAGFVDGGDILVTSPKIFIGLSDRTDRQGARALAEILTRHGVVSEIVQTPPDILHFKTGCALLDEETIFASAAMAATGIFAEFRVLEVPYGEEAAANMLRINDTILLPSGFPKTADQVAQLHPNIVLLDVSEVAKIDGGLSCMSLRWNSDPDPR